LDGGFLLCALLIKTLPCFARISLDALKIAVSADEGFLHLPAYFSLYPARQETTTTPAQPGLLYWSAVIPK
jgi:hypothetical protein